MRVKGKRKKEKKKKEREKFYDIGSVCRSQLF